MRCGVVIPIFKNYPTSEEKNSFVQCIKIFHKHPVILACPENFDESYYLSLAKNQDIVIGIERFGESFFTDIPNYNRLMLSLEFYRRFEKFKYILLYQLDAWVFRDELADWCSKKFDYIGAPWFENWHNASKDSPIIGVGNGGLSLRNVKKTSRLLIRMKIASILYNYLLKKERLTKILNHSGIYLKFINYLNKRRAKGINEDFQIYQLSKIYNWYKIAPYEEAIKFSFDANPGVLYEMNDSKLPFGCHGWKRYEKDFWEKFIK
jgi:hypothetical protein